MNQNLKRINKKLGYYFQVFSIYIFKFYERISYQLTNYYDYQEYNIHEDEDLIALSYVGDIDIYELLY